MSSDVLSDDMGDVPGKHRSLMALTGVLSPSPPRLTHHGHRPPPPIAHGGALPLGSAVIRVSMKRRPFNHWARRRQLASDSQRLPADRQLVVADGLWFVVCGLWFVICDL